MRDKREKGGKGRSPYVALGRGNIWAERYVGWCMGMWDFIFNNLRKRKRYLFVFLLG